MKILKPGKVEQKKFTCEKCGCVFVADKEEVIIVRENYGDYIGLGVPSLRCPLCGIVEIRWSDGEPYEEPVEDYKAMISTLSDMIYDGFSTDEDTATEIAAMLVANGVTFREG